MKLVAILKLSVSNTRKVRPEKKSSYMAHVVSQFGHTDTEAKTYV